MRKSIAILTALLLCFASSAALAEGIQQPGIQQPGIQQPGIQQPGVQQPEPQTAAAQPPAAPAYLENGLLAPGSAPVIERIMPAATGFM